MNHIDLSPFLGRTLSTQDWQHLMLRILFTPRKSLFSFGENIISKSIKSNGLNPELLDPLLTLLGYQKDLRPEMNHQFNSEMGFLFEAVVKIIFFLSDQSKFSDNFNCHVSRLSKRDKEKYKKIRPDFTFGSIAIETKYRFASKQGITEQRNTCKVLKSLGFRAVYLSYRRSPNTPKMIQSGWEAYEGEDCIQFIYDQTGVNINEVFAYASQSPLIKRRVKALQTIYENKICESLKSNYLWSRPNHKVPIHKAIIEDDAARRVFITDVGYQDEALNSFIDGLLSHSEDILSDGRFKALVADIHNKKNNVSAA